MKIKKIVYENIHTGQKMVTVPKHSNIKKGDAVWIEKVKRQIDSTDSEGESKE